MFELLSYTRDGTFWVVGRVITIEKTAFHALTDVGTFISGAIAGGVGRAAVLSIDNGGVKGAQQTVLRRMPQFGLLMMFYCPVAATMLPGQEREPRVKMIMTFLVAACAGYNMRFICNPINRVANECLRTGQKPLEVIRLFQNKTVLHFWYAGPNLIANALYFGTLLTLFEGLRRYTERNILPIHKTPVEEAVVAEDGTVQLVRRVPEGPAVVERSFNLYNYATTVMSNAVLGGTAAAAATTICYPYSAHTYLQTVIHDSVICRGLMPTLRKEVPMMAVSFATFSALQPIFGRRHGVRCGFGY